MILFFCFARHPKARRLQSTAAAARHYDMGGPGVNAILFFWRGSSSRTSFFVFFGGTRRSSHIPPSADVNKMNKRPGRFGSVRFIEASVRFPRFGLALGTEPRRFRIVRFGTGSVPVLFGGFLEPKAPVL